MTDAAPLIEQVRSGESFELQLLAAQGILPLPVEDLIPLQVHLAQVEDPMVAGLTCSHGSMERAPQVLWFAVARGGR